MRIAVTLILILLLAGCNAGTYNMPREQYRQEVRTLGVLPVLVDSGSTILHPRRQEVLDLLYRHSAGKDEWLVEMLREQKAYFDVREVPGTASTLFGRLVSGSAIRGKGGGLHRQYRFDRGEVAQLCRANGVDGLLVVILNGIVRPEKRWDRDRTSLNYLQTDYNVVISSAAVVLPGGEVAWELSPEAGRSFLSLQYPDFDEAFYNATEEVPLRFVEVAGVERLLTRREDGLFSRSSLPRAYRELFSTIADSLAPRLLERFSPGGAAPEKTPSGQD